MNTALAQAPEGGDGKLTKAEAGDAPWFDKLDRDEIPAALFDRLDADKDGFVTPEELGRIRNRAN